MAFVSIPWPDLFLILITALLALGYGYVAARVIPPLGLPLAFDVLLWAFVVLLVISPGAMFYLRFRRPGLRAYRPFAWFNYGWFGFLCVAATLLVLRDIGWIAGQILAGLFLDRDLGALLAELPVSFFPIHGLENTANAIVLGLAGGLCLLGFRAAHFGTRVVPVRIPVPEPAAGLAGLRIAQISDVHIGPMIRSGFVQSIVDRVNALEADLVVITGDLVDGPAHELALHARPLADLRATHGVYFVTGNHEFYSGARTWIRELRGMGIEVLENENRLIEKNGSRLLVAGVHDISGPAFGVDSDPEAAARTSESTDFRILLAHQPRSVYAAARAGFDLQLSGHTHGGQFFPGNLLVHFFQPFVRGLGRHENTMIYVNQGTGYWGPPLRLGAPSEITLLTLVSEDRPETVLR